MPCEVADSFTSTVYMYVNLLDPDFELFGVRILSLSFLSQINIVILVLELGTENDINFIHVHVYCKVSVRLHAQARI